jgi:hypothetical protein
VVKSTFQNFVYSCNLQKSTQSKQSPKRRIWSPRLSNYFPLTFQEQLFFFSGKGTTELGKRDEKIDFHRIFFAKIKTKLNIKIKFKKLQNWVSLEFFSVEIRDLA